MLEPQSEVGEGCSGRGAQTRRPGSSGGRGSAGTGQLDLRVPFPHPSRGVCAHALREGGGGSSLWRAELSGVCSER